MPGCDVQLVELKDGKYEARVRSVCVQRERRGESRCSVGPVCWRKVRWRRAVHCDVFASNAPSSHLLTHRSFVVCPDLSCNCQLRDGD